MRMQSFHSHLPLVAGLLLAVYGSAGVLGYGLHSLWGCGHCHEGTCQHDSDSHSLASLSHFGHDHQLFDRVPGTLAGVQSCCDLTHQGELVLAEEDCPICAFLVQAQSQFVFQVASECVDVVPTIPPAIVSSYVSPLLGIHPGRGPPTC